MTTSNSNASVDLAKMFGAVAKAMTENQVDLNQADSYNHDHGDNMVQIFNTITKAIQEKPTGSAAAQLGNASTALAKITTSGSAKLYSEGLKNAANQFKGTQSLTATDAMQLIQLLLGSSGSAAQSTAPSTSAGGDLLGSILGGLTGSQQTQGNTDSGGDLLGSVLGGMTGSQQTQGNDDSGIDLADILNAGAAFLNAKESGKSGLGAVLSSLVTGSTVANQDYRSQSATLVANTLINVISQMAKAKK